MFKKTIANILSLTLIIGLLIPNSIIARPFTTDPDLRVYPDNETLVFPETRVGETRTEMFTIENVSNTTKTVLVTSLPRAPFLYPTSTTLEITPNSTRSFPVNFSPTHTGQFESSLSIQNRGTNEVKTISLKGNSNGRQTNQGLEVSNTNLNFPTTIIGEVAQATISVTNRNNFPVNLTYRFNNSNQFETTLNRNTNLEANQTINVSVLFRPNQVKNFNDTFVITANSDNGNSSVSVRIRANSIAATNSSNPDLEINSNGNINFGTVAQNESSYQSIRLKNNGNRPLIVTILNAPQEPFSVDLGANNQTVTTIPEGQTRNLRVRFNPKNVGTYSAQFYLESTSYFNQGKLFTLQGNVLPRSSANNSNLSLLHYVDQPTITDQNPATTIFYTTNQSANTKVDILRNGVVVKTLKNNRTNGGQEYKAVWDATNNDKKIVSNGTYTYRIKTSSNNRNESIQREGQISVQLNKYVVEHTNHEVTVTRSTINPDLNELVYFNLKNPVSNLQLQIIDTKSNQVIYSKNANQVDRNFQLSWNGRNYADNKVSAGTYIYNIFADQFASSGRVNVIRNKNHNSENFVLYFENDPFYSQYGVTAPGNTTNNEFLIQGLTVAPRILTAHNASVYTSFMMEHSGPVTANILDQNKTLIKTVIRNMPTGPGYKRNFIDWNTLINGQPAPNGQYFFEITTARLSESDSDLVPFIIDRGPYIPNFKPQPETKVQEFYYPYQVNKPQLPLNQIQCLDFIDVEGQTEFCNAVTLSVMENLFTGDQNKTLRPDDFSTRSETTAILVRLLGVNPTAYNPNIDGNLGLKDLDPTQWYMPYYKTLSQISLKQGWAKQLLTPYADGTIRPTQPITRGEFYKYSLEAIKLSKNLKSNFKLEAPQTNTDLKPYTSFIRATLNQTDFARKYYNTFDLTPQTDLLLNQAITRAEIIEFIYTLVMTNQIEFQI